jgi:hypothetical protein
MTASTLPARTAATSAAWSRSFSASIHELDALIDVFRQANFSRL